MNNQFLSSVTKLTAIILLLLFTFFGCSSGDSTGSTSKSGINFDSGLLAPGETFSFTFQKEGTVPYYCRNHQPDMTGKVIVSQDADISGQDTVEMMNERYHPSQITITPNTKIVWINKETDPSIDDHTVTSGKPPSSGGGGPY